MSDFIIREALASDAFDVIEYLKRVGAETNNLTFGAEGFPVTPELEAKIIESKRTDERSVMYVAVKNNKIIGSGSLDGLPRRMKHRAEAGISVVKDEWGKGVATALMQALIDYANEHNIEIINAESRVDNIGSIKLCEKFGFKQVGVIPAYFKIEEQYIDFVSMYLDLRKHDKS